MSDLCHTCKHWTQTFGEPGWDWANTQGRCVEIRDKIDLSEYAVGHWVSQRQAIETDGDFGCVLHKAKEESGG